MEKKKLRKGNKNCLWCGAKDEWPKKQFTHNLLICLASTKHDGKKELMRENGSMRVACRHNFLSNASLKQHFIHSLLVPQVNRIINTNVSNVAEERPGQICFLRQVACLRNRKLLQGIFHGIFRVSGYDIVVGMDGPGAWYI